MHIVDWLTTAVYLFLVTALGVYFSRSNTNFKAYMFGNNSVPWVAVGISLIATSVSATTFLGNPADAYKNNMTYMMCNIGGLLSLLVISFIFIPKFRQANISSAYQLLEDKFSRPVRLLASILYCFHLLMRTGILLFGPSLVLSKMLNVNIVFAICLLSLLAILYTWFGGIRAVIWTDVMQFIVLFGGGMIVLYFLRDSLGGFSELFKSAQDAGKTQWLDFTMDPSNARTFLSAGLVYTFFEVAIRGCDQQFVQRYLSTKDTKSAIYSSILSVVLGAMVALLFYFIGAGLFSFYQVSEIAGLPSKLSVNEIFPHYILNELPIGLTGLLMAAILAAAMSSLDSAMTALSNTIVIDILHSNKTHNDKLILKSAKKWVVIIGLVGTGAAIVASTFDTSLLTMALSVTGLFTGPLLALFILAFYFPHHHPKAVLISAILGMLTLAYFTPPKFLQGIWTPFQSFSWPWFPLIAFISTLIYSMTLHLFYKKNS